MVGFWQQFIVDFFALIKAPAQYPQMMWIVLPILIVIILMTLYFARYKDEELGWNTALGNALVLIFVSLDLFREIYLRGEVATLDNFATFGGITFIVALLFIEGIVLLFVNFTHALPKRISYLISSPLSVYLLAYTVIALVYSQIILSITSVLALIVLFLVLLGIFYSMGIISRQWWRRVDRIKAREHIEDVKKASKVLATKKQEVKQEEKKIKIAVKNHVKEVKDKKVELVKIKKAARKRNGTNTKKARRTRK